MSSFNFQEPGSAKLQEAIEATANCADSGVGVFAFASTSGVKALFELPLLVKLISQKKTFHLIVGIDAITNAEALLSIEDEVKKYKGYLIAEAFFHNHPASTFHPKFIWFAKGNELGVIVGSGNLTLRGFGKKSVANPAPGNWEAFGVQTLTGEAVVKTLGDFEKWLEASRALKMLRPLDDEGVKSRAMANGLVRYAVIKPPVAGKPVGPIAVAAPVDDLAFDNKDILVRELPKTRPGQADIGKDALTNFFGHSGVDKNVLLQNVSLDNVLGDTEKRRLFVNASQNYRLELQAMGGLPYTIAKNDDRMILIATKLDRRSFRYTIVPVTAGEYSAVVKLLGTPSNGRRLMREKYFTGSELVRIWRKAPANLVPTVSETPSP